MTSLILQIFTTYIITAVIVRSNVLYGFREWFKKKTSWLKRGGRHFIDCRMCVGLYVSIGVGLAYSDIYSILVIYGASYFLATQER